MWYDIMLNLLLNTKRERRKVKDVGVNKQGESVRRPQVFIDRSTRVYPSIMTKIA